MYETVISFTPPYKFWPIDCKLLVVLGILLSTFFFHRIVFKFHRVFTILEKFQVFTRMTNLRPDLKGAERAKFFQALIEKINNVCDGNTVGENVNRLVNTFANPNQSSQPPIKMKKCQTLAERPSVSCAKIDDGRREYVVRRVKFAKRALDSRRQNLRPTDDSAAVTVVESQSRDSRPSSTTRFENTKRKLFEIEKEKLKELYGRSNSRERADDVKNDNPMIADRRRRQICDKIPTPPPSPEALEKTCSEVAAAAAATARQEICLPALEYNSTRSSDNAEETRPNAAKSKDETDRPTTAIALDMSENITTSNQESGALRSIDDNETVSTNTLSTQISNRRSRQRQLRRRLPCAHCRQPISEVSFFNGAQQLCNQCADSHFERVTRARLKDRPMSYREFKNVGGDTVYARVCEQCPK